MPSNTLALGLRTNLYSSVFNPTKLFDGSTAGFSLSFDTTTSLYQDNTGTTPLTTPEQQVGLAADQSRTRSPITVAAAVQASLGLRPKWGRAPKVRRNLVLSTEDLTNAAWTKTNVVAASAVRLTYNGGSTPTTAYLQQNIAIVGGTASKPFTVRAVLSGSGKIRLKNSQVGVLDNYSTDIVLTGTPTPYTLTVTNGASAGTGVQSFGLNPATDNSAFDVTISEFQPEQSATATAYQKVTTAFDMTEAGLASYGFIRPDLLDDVLTVTTPAAQTGDVLVFGRNGSWIESGVTYGSGAAVTIGINTVTGLPAGLLTAIGDIVGIVAIGRTLTAAERTMALEYHKARGAAGWLVAGVEMLTNGAFTTDLTGWTNENVSRGTSTWVAGQAFLDNSGTGNTVMWQSVPTVIGQAYMMQIDSIAQTSATGRVFAGTTATNGNLRLINPASYPSTNKGIFLATTTTTFICCSAVGATGGNATFDNASLKPLVAS